MKKLYLLMIAMLIPALTLIHAKEPPLHGIVEKNSPEYFEITGKPSPFDEQTNVPMKPITDLAKDIPEGGLILIPHSGNNAVMSFDPETGALLDMYFIPEDGVNLSTPIEITFDGNTFFITDQLKRLVQEYDQEGQFIGTFAPIGGENVDILNNIRGMLWKENGNLLVTVAAGGNAHAIAEFDSDGNYLGNFIASGEGGLNGPWDILYRHEFNDYLVSASGSSGIHRFDAEGNFIEMFATGIAFPQQMHQLSNGNILVTNFSAPAGVYEFSSTGTQLGYYNVIGSLRGVYELPDETILVTSSSGVHRINRDNQNLGQLVTGNARFITLVKPATFNISLGSGFNVLIGNSANLGDNLQINGGEEPYTFSWSLQDSEWTSEEQNPSFAFVNEGLHVFTLEVTDDEDAVASANLSVYVYLELTVDAGEDQYAQTGHMVVLGGEPAYEGGMEPFTMLWTLEDSDWTHSDANPEVSFEEKGVYHFTLAVTDAEENTASDNVTLTVYEPLVADAGDDHEVLVNEDFTLGGTPPASEGIEPYTYLWTLEGSDWTSTDANPTASLPDEGTYIFTLTVTDAIENTASDMVTVVVEEEETFVWDITEESLNIYPNPASGDVIFIRFPEQYNGEIIITDISGREVYRQPVNTLKHELHISGWSNGVYILKAGEKEHKFIIR